MTDPRRKGTMCQRKERTSFCGTTFSRKRWEGDVGISSRSHGPKADYRGKKNIPLLKTGVQDRR